jgi:predicted Zn-dependent protease
MLAKRHSRLIAVGLAAVVLAVVGVCIWRWNERQADRARVLELVAQKKYAEAEPELRRLHERDPEDVDVIVALTRTHIARGGRVTDLEPFLNRWCELRPHDPAPFHARLDMWLRLFVVDRALEDANRLAELEPGNDDVARTRARLLAQVGRFADADAETSRLLAARPGDPALIFLRADVLHQSGDRTRAATLLEPLLARDPPYVPAARLRGIIYAQADPPDPERAIPLLRQALAAQATAADRNQSRYHLAQMLFRAGRTDEARRELEALRQGQIAERMVVDARQQPGNLDLHVRAARVCLENGLASEAENLLLAVIERDPRHGPANRILAELYEKHGERDRAAEHRRRAGAD